MWTLAQEANWEELKYVISNGDGVNCREALIKIKDAVIGSNKQKGALISHDLVPIILHTCIDQVQSPDRKMDALVILGSLAKGSEEQVECLVKQYNIVPYLLKEIMSKDNSKKCVETCLSTLRSIFGHTCAPKENFLANTDVLKHFLRLASAGSSLKTQICITSILVSVCQTNEDQLRLLHAGTLQILSRMICYDNEDIQIPALRCLSCMCYSNRSVADNICVISFQGRSLPDILNSLTSRLFPAEIQLIAARCLTYIYRSGTLPSTDNRISQKALPTLARLCAESFDHSIIASASETLAYLIEIDSELQRTAAITNHLLKSLSDLLQSQDPGVKQAALCCFASLGANDEAIRKRLMDTYGLINAILNGLKDSNSRVKLSAIRCLHSLSRSVQQLRTTFQDYTIWEPLMAIFTTETSIEFLVAVTSTICNLVLEFSPSKEPIINAGIIERLCQYTMHADPSLRLNSIWALMNMSFQSEMYVKTDIINMLGTKRILELVNDSDTRIVMKTLGLLRNLLSKTHHIEIIMRAYSCEVLEAINKLLESDHSSEVKEQAFCIIGNISAEDENGDYIIMNNKIMAHLAVFLFHHDRKLQAGTLFAIYNLVHRKDSWSMEKYSRLSESNIIKNVNELNKKNIRNKAQCEDYISRTLKQIVIQCKHFYPEILQ
ncbi:armadillo repeat-containing protein 8-like [Bactrocera neohumeralis]|uniref:armadillo repeat-containing protein 8-like n=1 Tax=Bactrocera neohumeralis TaxID=98809 RepID=UPI0021653BED|nr:armadillo repeat-containing protein 8-like [Bactrocera neohumeralis]